MSAAKETATEWASSFTTLEENPDIIRAKSLIFLMAAAFSPYFSRSSQKAAFISGIRFSTEAAISALIEVSPIPLAGLFTTLLKDSSSAGFAASLKYAITSLTSALSKNEFPENIIYGIFLLLRASSRALDWEFVLYNIAKS